MLYAVVVIAFAVLVGLWLIFGPGPRRARAFARARRLLARESWDEALAIAKSLQAAPGLKPAWQEQLRTLIGDCYQVAADASLREKRFEEALDHGRQAAIGLRLDPADQETRIVERMLAEARRLFAARETEAVVQLVQRAFAIRSPCPEGSFWLGLCQIRSGDIDAALALLRAANEQSGKQFLDAAFYLGLLLHRRGQSQEALRYLAEANRVDGSCPFVTWEMGITLVDAGGDPGLAARALRKALGPRGLSLWLQNPDRAWVEAFPEGHSYIRRLAEHHLYVCPVLGGELHVLLRQGRQALAQALLQQGSYQEAADIFTQLLQEIPPTAALVRGLGLALARMQQYDQAYKHLRIALEAEQPKDPLTAGYLALCGARARPTQPEDKPKNVQWALRLLARYPMLGDAEWSSLLAAVHAEAREINLPIGVEDQVLLCDTMAANRSCDATAIAAYRHLAASFPEAVKPTHAWLFMRAAATGLVPGVGDGREAWLFSRAFADPAGAREFFQGNGWDFSDAEYAFLERSAVHAPGQFPVVPGTEFSSQGEQFLLQRSQKAEKAGDAISAQKAAETLLKLAPQSPAAHDRLACLLYRKGETARAAELLEGWQRLSPNDHWPLVRRAILEQEQGNAARRAEAIDRALGLTRGPLRAAVAFLGARLALRQSAGDSSANGTSAQAPRAPLSEARHLLEECLRADPFHTDAQWCLAAVRSAAGERDALAAQAPSMDRPRVRDGRFHYIGAVSYLAAGEFGKTLELVRRAAYADSGLTSEAYFLTARVHLEQNNGPEAREALDRAAADGPSAALARLLLGKLCFEAGSYGEAVRWWERVEPALRTAWKVDEPLRQTAFLAALEDFSAGRYERAAERFRDAGRLGLRDRRLGQLLMLAHVHAGRSLLYGSDESR
jgi:tetratricopeptide (TPR) repeat protein